MLEFSFISIVWICIMFKKYFVLEKGIKLMSFFSGQNRWTPFDKYVEFREDSVDQERVVTNRLLMIILYLSGQNEMGAKKTKAFRDNKGICLALVKRWRGRSNLLIFQLAMYFLPSYIKCLIASFLRWEVKQGI